MDRYGPELEYDLHGRGVDLLDFIRGVHPWGKLIRLAEQLPRSSRYQAALADDDEMAERYLNSLTPEQEEMSRSGRMRQARTMAGWSDDVAVMADLVDGVNALHATLAQANSRKGERPKPKPYPRPVVAVERIRRRRDLVQADDVRVKFSPKEAG